MINWKKNTNKTKDSGSQIIWLGFKNAEKYNIYKYCWAFEADSKNEWL